MWEEELLLPTSKMKAAVADACIIMHLQFPHFICLLLYYSCLPGFIRIINNKIKIVFSRDGITPDPSQLPPTPHRAHEQPNTQQDCWRRALIPIFIHQKSISFNSKLLDQMNSNIESTFRPLYWNIGKTHLVVIDVKKNAYRLMQIQQKIKISLNKVMNTLQTFIASP